MNRSLRQDAEQIVRSAIEAVQPGEVVKNLLRGKHFPGRVFLVSVGKAGWFMAQAAQQELTHSNTVLSQGIVITKYHHVLHELPGIFCYEAGHPVPDENGFLATKAVLDMTEDLLPSDTVLFLLSGGGSALFEKPLISGEELQRITGQLLSSGANIQEINTIRKRLSAVKGGRFAQHCAPAHICAVILSDVLGDSLDMIASGPVSPDTTTSEQALHIADVYGLTLSAQARLCLGTELPKTLSNTECHIVGSVRDLCRSAATECLRLGYEPVFLSDRLCCEARDAGTLLAGIAATHAAYPHKRTAWLAGGECVVHVKGNGLGGRNQELVLAGARELAGISDAAIISVGSDGTDGPTDAAGGYADGCTLATLEKAGISYDQALTNNDAYHALQASNGLIITGPTGTNVNDICVVLLQ